MVTVSDKKLCQCCFAEISSEPCPECGFSSAGYAADPAVLPCGSMLQKRYIVGRVIGKGGFGITYLAYDTKLERKVAIKEFYPYGLATRNIGDTVVIVSNEETAEAFRKGAEKFYNEARLIARFNGNPGIVGVYDFFYENATVYFTMEYLKGQTLRSYVAGNGVLSDGQAVFLAEKITMALMTIHSANVLHRDISPDNIMLCADGSIKLIDFGAARQVVANCSHDLSVILKPGFAPLEQYQKKGKQGPWTDIYSLGASLYFALTHDTPDDPMSRLENDENISENAEMAESIEPKLWEIIRKAVMLKAADRYQNVFELRNDLKELPLTAVPIIEPKEQPETTVPFGVTAQPYTATARRTSNTAAPNDNRTVPLTDPSLTVPLNDSSATLMDPSITVIAPPNDTNYTIPLASSDTGAASSSANKPKSHKNLVYAASAAAILIVGIFSGVLISRNGNDEIATETTTTAKDQVIYDSKEGIYAVDDEDNDVTEETSVTTPEETDPKETEPPVAESEETKTEKTEPPVTEPEEPETRVTKPSVTTPTTPKVTKPPVTTTTTPKVTKPPVTTTTAPKVTKPPVTTTTAPKVTKPAVATTTAPKVTKPAATTTAPKKTSSKMTRVQLSKDQMVGIWEYFNFSDTISYENGASFDVNQRLYTQYPYMVRVSVLDTDNVVISYDNEQDGSISSYYQFRIQNSVLKSLDDKYYNLSYKTYECNGDYYMFVNWVHLEGKYSYIFKYVPPEKKTQIKFTKADEIDGTWESVDFCDVLTIACSDKYMPGHPIFPYEMYLSKITIKKGNATFTYSDNTTYSSIVSPTTQAIGKRKIKIYEVKGEQYMYYEWVNKYGNFFYILKKTK